MVLNVAVTSLISLLFVTALQMMFKGGKVKQLEWDISTVTAGDYTVEFEISEEGYRDWHQNSYEKRGGEKS